MPRRLPDHDLQPDDRMLARGREPQAAVPGDSPSSAQLVRQPDVPKRLLQRIDNQLLGQRQSQEHQQDQLDAPFCAQ